MKKNMVWVVVCLMLTIALFDCGGGGGGSSDPVAADTMTVTISSPTGTVTKTYTEGTYNTLGHLDPDLFTYVFTALNQIEIELHSEGSNTQGATVILISVEGNTPQSYPIGITTPANYIEYVSDDTHSSLFSSTSGTITLSSIGNAGKKIIGTFDAIVTDTSNTLRILGTFSVTRDI
jgi:hypothetical protein